ncbi:MAG: leucine-rich repeat domain-containing protein [bacterium]|nr:leucine-rich repeat domain-containing protein [bacterium]
MRKNVILSFFLAVLGLLSFGCGKKNNTTNTERTTITTKEDHVHEFGDWELLVDSTCTEVGTKKRSCACGKVEFADVELKPHTYVNDVCSVCGAEKITDGFVIDYNENAQTYIIRGYNGTSTSPMITRTYNDGIHGVHNLIVLSNVEDEMSTCCLSESNITKLRLSKDFTEMDKAMFSGMINLEEVVLPSSLTAISERAFQNCPRLKSVTYGEVSSIGHFAFDGCGFTKVVLPNSIKYLLSNAFSNNTSLTEITLNDGLKEVGNNAFNNTKINRIIIPQSLTAFGYQEKMEYLTGFSITGLNVNFSVSNNCLIDIAESSVIRACKNATIPTTVKNLGLYSFANLDYSGLNQFVIPDNVEYVSGYAFSNSKFKDIDFGKIEGLGNKVFYDTIFTNYDSKTIVLPNTLTLINDDAFQNLYANEITIPSSVTTLGSAILKGSKITLVNIYNSTIESEYCSMYWNSGYVGTINIIDD